MLRGSEAAIFALFRTGRTVRAEDFGYGEHVVVVIEVPPAAVVLHEQVDPCFFSAGSVTKMTVPSPATLR